MAISNQQPIAAEEDAAAPERGPRARTAKLMLETASALMQRGLAPSVSEVAEAAEVSRATAYRYFPTQADLVQAVVDEALGPILDWRSPSLDAEARTADLLETSLPRIDAYEATFRAALKLSLDEWSARQAGGGEPDNGSRFKRGHRIGLLRDAIAPLRGAIRQDAFERLAKALSLVFGVETLVVLKDIWNADSEETQAVALWAARALVRAAIAEAGNQATGGGA